MTPDQLPDPLQLRNLVRSLAMLDVLTAPQSTAVADSASGITFAPGSEPHTQTASLPSSQGSAWNLLFTHDGATLSQGDITIVSTLDHPSWESSTTGTELPDVLTGTPEAAQQDLARRYQVRPDLLPIRQLLMSVPLTIDLARELGSVAPWTDIRSAAQAIGYPIPDEDLAGPDSGNSGTSLA